jgi:hypothetical protein
MTKTQRRLAQKLLLPLVALVMMTLTMALAGTSHSAPPPPDQVGR